MSSPTPDVWSGGKVKNGNIKMQVPNMWTNDPTANKILANKDFNLR